MLVFEYDVLTFMWACCAKVEEKQSFYDELKGEWNMHSAGDLVMFMGEFNGHVGRYIDRFDGACGAYGIGQRNLEGRML